MSDTNPCLAAALAYAGNKQRPLYIFPSSPGDAKKGAEKKSRVSGRHTADGKNWGMTNNADTINSYWAKWPDSNVCIVTGEINGLFVLETDTDAHGKDGEAELKRLIVENENDWPNTRVARSPSGSLHYYFTWPAGDIIILNSDNKIAPGVDVRGDGGMVVAPPSFNPKYDARYEWINDVGIAAAPKWLIELLASKPVIKKVGDAQAPTDKLDAAMQLIPNHDGVIWDVQDWKSKEVKQRTGWDGWNDIAMALYRATAGSDEGFRIFDKWCQRNIAKYDARYTHYSWYRRYRTSPPRGIGAGTLFMLADEHAPGWRGIWEEEHPEETKAQKDEYKDKKRAEEEVKTKAAIVKGHYSIQVIESELHRAIDLTEECLIANKSPFYIFSKKLVSPVVIELNTSQHDPVTKKVMTTKIASFAEVTADYLTDHVNRHIEFLKYNKKDEEWKAVDPPLKVITRLMSRVNELSFPNVSGIITTQTMRPDGSLITQPGWDESTGLLLIDPPIMPVIDEKPSRGAVLESKELLLDLLEEVKFSENDEGVSLAVLMSQMMTPVLRGAFPVCPMHVNRSPSPGSGKSYMFDIVSHIVIGQPMPVMAAGRNSEETEKRLGAALMAGQPLINIDNIAGELGGDALCQIIERPIVNIRVLGKSELRTIASRGTSLFCNGNNMVLIGDVVRRSIIATIDTGLERPELRVFKKNPVAMIMANRGKYIAACLTLCRAYIVAGSPNKAPRLGSFGEWSDIVRSTIMWLGMADPVKSMEIGREEDPDLAAHRDFCQAMTEVLGAGQSYRFTCAQIVDMSQENGAVGSGYDQFDFAWPEFQLIVAQVAGFRGNKPEALRLSRWMRLKKNRPVDGMVIRSKQIGNVMQWWIEKQSDPQGGTPGKKTNETANVVHANFSERRKPS